MPTDLAKFPGISDNKAPTLGWLFFLLVFRFGLGGEGHSQFKCARSALV